MIIRDASPSDTRGVRVLIAQLGYPDLNEKEVDQKIRNHQQVGYKMLVAEADSVIVGFASLHWAEMPHRRGLIGRVTAMCTLESHRSRGIGAKLIAEAEKIFLEAGCELVEVTSNNRRTEAHAFYVRQGYEHTSSRFVKQLVA